MKKIMFLALWGAAACSATTPTQGSSRLTASADAQHLGIAAYAVAADQVTLFDRDGVEAGRIAVSAPAPDTRVFTAEYADGATDEADVGRPMRDGRFLAPITPETILTAALADTALAPLWAAHEVRFVLDAQPLLQHADANTGLALSDIANTGSCSSYSCSGSGCTPAGCAKPANPTVGCTNPASLPASSTDSRSWVNLASGYSSGVQCGLNKVNNCIDNFGGTSSDWSGAVRCVGAGDGTYDVECLTGGSNNSWVASCPQSSCGIGGQYDAVPRNGACLQPGSCTYSTGAVSCTPYH